MMKLFQHGDTYVASRGAFFDGNVKVNGNLILPPETHVWGRLLVAGRLEIGPRSSVGEGVESQSAIIGSHVKIKGPLRVLEDVLVCDNAHIHSIDAGGNVTLRSGVGVGEVRSDETIYVYGRIRSGKLLGRNVKVYGN